MTSTVVRRLATVATALTGLVVASLALAGPASADVPEGWPDREPVDTFEMLLLMVGLPILLAVVITLAVYVPALVRGESIKPGPTTVEDQWLGGPRRSPDELAAPDTEDSQAGGAGSHW